VAQRHQMHLPTLHSAAINFEIRNQCAVENDENDTAWSRAIPAMRLGAGKSRISNSSAAFWLPSTAVHPSLAALPDFVLKKMHELPTNPTSEPIPGLHKPIPWLPHS